MDILICAVFLITPPNFKTIAVPKKSEKLLVELAIKHNLRIIHGSAEKGQGLPEIAKELRLIVQDLKQKDAEQAKLEAEKAQQALLRVRHKQANDNDDNDDTSELKSEFNR